MSKEVIILGGGVAGMSAAHELLTRGFNVKVYEHKHIAGGKARSMSVPGSGIDGRKDLPGEHGFRFFPRFYKHLPDTMKQIPLPDGGTVFDNLTEASRIRIARYDEASILMSSRFPRTLDDLKVVLDDIFHTSYGFEPGEVHFFADKLWQLMTSCYDRRLNEYEKIAWWDYIEAEGKSKAFQTLLAEGLTKTLVASNPKLASTRTGGDILLQLLFDIAKPGESSDRLLNGPTNDVWIDPWLDWMRSNFKGKFEYHFNHQLNHIECNTTSKKIDYVTLCSVERGGRGKMLSTGEPFNITGDYYIAAVPVEVFSKQLTPNMTKVDPTLKSVVPLAKNVNWMNGMQFYLSEDVKIDHGHCIYVDAEWALTSISQIQFWKDFPIEQYGNGKVKGIISVDISEWFGKGLLNDKPASESTREEIKDEVWAQLKKSLNVNGEVLLKDEQIIDWFIDPDIITPDDGRVQKNVNTEPLLVNEVNTWHLRPTAHTRIKNFFLASDYVQTNTDLATMEGANEAARRAVNSIIQDSKVNQIPCKIWKLHEPDVLAIWRFADQENFEKGEPWDNKLDFLKGLRIRILLFLKKLFSKN